MKHLILDLEIQKNPDDVEGGWSSTHLLGVAIAVTYEEWSDRFKVYGANDLDALRQSCHDADRITGFNVLDFDLPVLLGISRPDWRKSAERAVFMPKTNDLLRRIWTALGYDPDIDGPKEKGWNLDTVCRLTLGRGKIGDGKSAPAWFAAGEIARVVTYCMDDTALTRDLNRFINRYGYVIGKQGTILPLKRE